MRYECDSCGRIGTEDDLCEHGEPCPEEECDGITYDLAIQRVLDMADFLSRMTTTQEGEEITATAARVLRTLADVYVEHQLWTVDGSSGADDAAALYEILTHLGLEVP